MRQLALFVVAFCLVVVIVIPSLLVRGCNFKRPAKEAREIEVEVFSVETGKTMKLDLEEYVKGVVAAEMPASFNLEALKAQAVAARTFAVRKARVFGGNGCEKHPGVDLCTDFKHCQAWISRTSLRTRWSYLDYFRYWYKVSQAVSETEGLIVAYNGEPIDAAYHATCGGATENSEDVWSKSVPYLRSVSCDFDGHADKYREKKAFTFKELEDKLKVNLKVRRAVTRKVTGRVVKVETEGWMESPVEVLGRTSTGRVKLLRVGNKVFSGADLRTLLDLRSTAFTLQVSGTGVYFSTTGYGHGVGLCQYGADGLANQGKDFREILAYYYKGIEVISLRESAVGRVLSD